MTTIRINHTNGKNTPIPLTAFLNDPNQFKLKEGETLSIWTYIKTSTHRTDTLEIREPGVTAELYYDGWISEDSVTGYQLQVEGTEPEKIKDAYIALLDKVTTRVRMVNGKLFVANLNTRNPMIAYLLNFIASWLNKHFEIKIIE